MALIDNINILKAYNPVIWEELRVYGEEQNKVLFKEEETRRGDKTLALSKDGNLSYLHSKYNPIREAEVIVESYADMAKDTNVIFYGTGLGYHIRLILEKYPNIKYYIYEPIPELMYHFISTVNLKTFKPQRILGMNIGTVVDSRINKLIDTIGDKFTIIEMPSHKQNFPEEYKEFENMLLEIIKGKKQELYTNYTFQKRWITNSITNFKEVLLTPNIIMEKKNCFKGKPAILVAAGPSLNEEIENLKYIKENGLAYIFSVGSAINTLIYNEIYPDAACTYDPEGYNQKVFDVTKEKGIAEIPLIFGSSVGYETLVNYPGKKYHMITSQDAVANYYLKGKDYGPIGMVQDAPSIAVITLQLLHRLGFQSIILVGQNLGYRDKERYSTGISYSEEVTEEELGKGMWVKGVNGNEILTNNTFQSMRRGIELYIREFPNINVINTTQGGAHIEGTEFIGLKDLISKGLNQDVTEENWLDGMELSYDVEYLMKQRNKMKRSYAATFKLIKDYYDTLDQITKLIHKRNFKQIENMYTTVDRAFRKIENNDYFNTFILPMNRVEYKILVDSIDNLNAEKDPYIKGENIVKSFTRFMDTCNKDIKRIEPIYEKLQKDIDEVYNMDY